MISEMGKIYGEGKVCLQNGTEKCFSLEPGIDPTKLSLSQLMALFKELLSRRRILCDQKKSPNVYKVAQK